MSTQKASKLITLIVPCYNIEPYISRCMHSIMEQSIIDRCQVLCIDDGCTDRTPMHLARYERKNPNIVSVLERQNKYGIKNCGVSAARNMGLDFAIGQTVMFIDGDDLIGGRTEALHLTDKYYLENFYDTLMSHPETSMVVGTMDYVDRVGKQIIPTKRFDVLNERLDHDLSKHDQALDFLDLRISCCNTLFRTDLINKENPAKNVRFNPNMMYFEDAHFIMQYAFRALEEKYQYILQPTQRPAMYLYRSRPHSAMHKLSYHSESNMRCLERTKKRLEYYAYLIQECETHFGIGSRMYNIAAHRYANKTIKDIEKYAQKAYASEYDILQEYIPEECRVNCNDHDCGKCMYQYKLKYMCSKLVSNTK